MTLSLLSRNVHSLGSGDTFILMIIVEGRETTVANLALHCHDGIERAPQVQNHTPEVLAALMQIVASQLRTDHLRSTSAEAFGVWLVLLKLV